MLLLSFCMCWQADSGSSSEWEKKMHITKLLDYKYTQYISS